MKSLFLIRHAKSSWDNASLRDFERPLNKRGLANAPFMGNILKEKYNVKPDLVFSSPAVRAHQTAEIFSEVLQYPVSKIKTDKTLYTASVNDIIRVIHNITENNETVLIFGHNPELTETANYLSGKYIDNIPTSGLVKLNVTTAWKEVSEGSCTLDFFIYPKAFKSSG